jgi:hypothetical protein
MTTDDRERRTVFGEEADLYDAVRPGYPEALIDDVVAAAGPGPALEVGAGTGKATVALAARGLELTCLEPDPRMAARLRRNVTGARVIDTTFEAWTPDRRYGLVTCAQAWHWMDEQRRNGLAAAALASGGALALFWNKMFLEDPALRASLTDVYARYAMEVDTELPDTEPETISDDFAAEWSILGLVGDDRFTDLRSRRYRRTFRWPTERYVRFATTTSHYRILTTGTRDAALAGVAAAIDAHGGVISMVVDTDLALATRV